MPRETIPPFKESEILDSVSYINGFLSTSPVPILNPQIHQQNNNHKNQHSSPKPFNMENLDTKTIAVIGVGMLIVVGTGWAFKKGYSAQEECEVLKKAVEDLGNIITQQNQHLGMLTARITQLEALTGAPLPPKQYQQPQPQPHITPKQPPKPQPKSKPRPTRELPPVEEIEEEEVEEPGPEFDEQLRSELEGDVCDVNGNCKPKKKKA